MTSTHSSGSHLKAIETKYDGHRFRSRTEARWAVFFNELDIEYEYEYEGYILNQKVKYLPDFYLPEIDEWYEIKGHKNLNPIEMEKCALFTAYKSPIKIIFGPPKLPRVNQDYAITTGTRIMAFVKVVENPGKLTTLDIQQNESGIVFNPLKTETVDPSEHFWSFAEDDGIAYVGIDPRHWTWQQRPNGSFLSWPVPAFEITPPDKGDIPIFGPEEQHIGDYIIPLTRKRHDTDDLKRAYTAARSARFEHGETP